MILYGKIKGIFKCLPLESFDIKRICSFTDETPDKVQPILDKLVKENIIKGKRKYKLKKVAAHVKNIK